MSDADDAADRDYLGHLDDEAREAAVESAAAPFRTRVAALEEALRDVIAADCCGCSVYGNIAAKALNLSQEQVNELRARRQIDRYTLERTLESEEAEA